MKQINKEVKTAKQPITRMDKLANKIYIWPSNSVTVKATTTRIKSDGKFLNLNTQTRNLCGNNISNTQKNTMRSPISNTQKKKKKKKKTQFVLVLRTRSRRNAKNYDLIRKGAALISGDCGRSRRKVAGGKAP